MPTTKQSFIIIIFFFFFQEWILGTVKFSDFSTRDIYGNLIFTKEDKKFLKNSNHIKEKKIDRVSEFKKLFSKRLIIPENIKPIENFNIKLYMGKWHEIARLKHKFEEGLSRIVATYTLTQNSKEFEIINRAYKTNGELKILKGSGKYVNEEKKTIGHLKVTYLKPFYGSYIVFYLDIVNGKYQNALVCGSSREYCWILSRKSHLKKTKLDGLIKILKKNGFKTDELIFPQK